MERGFKARCENLSLQIRSILGLRKTDPLSPQSLANHLGIYLWKPSDITGLSAGALNQLRRDKNSWSAVTVSVGRWDVIIYNPSHSKGRQSSDIMHELSHVLLHHRSVEMMLFSEAADIVLREYDVHLEEEANWLSGCLLLPREALLWIKNHSINDYEACNRYGVNRDLLRYRMNITGVNKQVGRSMRHP